MKERLCVLWDLESIPFRYNCLVKKYLLQSFTNYHLEPKYMSVSKKNLRLIPYKKRSYELIVTDDISKDGADRSLIKKAKQHQDRTIVLVSNDLRLAKKLIQKKMNVVVFVNNQDMPDIGVPTFKIFNNFKEA